MSRSRTRGRRYDEEPKLNLKKVAGVIIALAVIIMIIISIINILKDSGKTVESKVFSYYSVYENGKFGIINNNGEIVIDPTYDERIAIPNKLKPVFICTYDIEDEKGTYKTKAINNKGEEILKGYEQIEAIDNFDSKQNIWYEECVLRVSKNGKYGMIELNGKEILSCDYDEITALEGVTNNFIVKKEDEMGLVNEAGQTIIKTEYKNILTLKEGYKSEYIIQGKDNKYGIISTSGSILLEPKYDEVKYVGSSRMFAVKENDVWKLINAEDGSIIIDGGYENIVEAKTENIIIENNGKYGIITKEKETKIEPQYEDLKYAFSIYYIAKKGEKYGIINLENETIVDFEYQNMIYIENGGFIEADKSNVETDILDSNLGKKITGIISEINTEKGYIKVYMDSEYKYYNFKLEEKNVSDLLTSNTLFLSKKNGKYGYVDKSGNIVVEYIYDDGTEQNIDGYAGIKKDGMWGSIDKAGVQSLEPSVNLDSNIYIDFIGAWHLNSSGLYYEK